MAQNFFNANVGNKKAVRSWALNVLCLGSKSDRV